MLGFVLIYQVAYAGRVYPGVRAFGQDLGGYSREEARLALQRSLDEFGRRELTLVYAERTWSFTAHELGLRSDAAPVLDAVFAVGRQGNPFARFATQFGLWRQGRSFEHPSAAFDVAAQADALKRIAAEIDRPVSEPKLTLRSDFTVDLQPSQSGRRLDIEESRQRLQQALSLRAVTRVELAVTETLAGEAIGNPVAAQEQANLLLSGPVTLKFDERRWVLDRPQLASVLRFNELAAGSDTAYLDRAPLEAWAKTLADAVERSPRDARFSWSGGKLGGCDYRGS
jgi:hypothetical protein